jgi:tetratricopeptide (TPR) repeat protein
VLGNLGALMIDRGQLDEALSSFEDAVSIAREIGDHATQLRNLNNIAFVHHECGRWGEALALFRQILAAHRQTEDAHGLALTLHNVGAVLADCGAFEQARRFLSECEETCRRLGDRIHLSMCLLKLGEVEWLSGRKAWASVQWDEAHSHAAAIGYVDVELPVQARRAVARSEADGGVMEEADDALRRSRELGRTDLLADVAASVAELKLGRAQRPEELENVLCLVSEAEKAIQSRGVRRDLYRLAYSRYSALAALKREDEAQAAIRAARQEAAWLMKQVPPQHLEDFLRHPLVRAILHQSGDALSDEAPP